MAALPAYAASTCIHVPIALDTAASSGIGSTAHELVVPMVAHTKQGMSPAALSASMAADNTDAYRADTYKQSHIAYNLCVDSLAGCSFVRPRLS